MATIADLKVRVNIDADDTGKDALLGALLDSVTTSIEAYLDRVVVVAAGADVRSERFDGGCTALQVRAWPIASITFVRVSLTRDFATATEYDELVANEDYAATPGDPDDRGWIYCEPEDALFPAGRKVIAVSYRGGYTDPADTPGEDDPPVVPAKFQQAALLQAAYLWQTRQQLGQQSTTLAGPGGVVVTQAKYELLGEVQDMLRGERRM